ncbi:MAG: hypothetical protein LAT84_06405 [Balneolia bacterium]|nr:hypothetical protein [Balneolia bacterium]
MQQPNETSAAIRQYRKLADDAWSKVRRQRVLTLAIAGISGFLAVFFVLMLIEQNAWLSPLLKVSLWVSGVIVGGLLWYGMMRRLPAPQETDFRRKLTRETELHELRYLLDLSQQTVDAADVLRDAAIDQNLAALQKIDESAHSGTERRITRWIGNSPASVLFRRVMLVFAGLLFINLLYGFMHTDAAQRSLAFFQAYEKPNPFVYTVEPGTGNVEQGSRFYVEITFEGDKPESVSMGIRTRVEDRFRTITLEETRPGTFVSSPKEIFEDSEYVIRMDEFESPKYELTVSQIPRFRELVARVVPPSYTGIEPERYTYPFSRIEMPEGSYLEIEATANKALSSAFITLHDGNREELELTDDSLNAFKAGLTITEPDTLRFRLEDDEGLQNRNPYAFNLRVIRDQEPTVRIVSPEPVVQILNPRDITLRIEARDDYGFSSMRLHYEVREAFSPNVREGSVRISGAAPASANVTYEWDLSDLRLQTSDEVTYWVEVFDNDEINGFKSARSERQTIRASSLAESLLEQEEQEDNVERRLEDLTRQQEESRENLRQLRESIIENPDETWEQERMTEEMMQQQEDLSEQVRELQEEFDRMREEMSREDTISEETRRKYEELQQLMDEIDDPAILEMLEQLQESLQNMDQQQIRDAMENLEFSEQNYQERLERTLELFKQLRLEADLDRMSALLEELARQEERVMEMEGDPDSQSQQQQSIQEELEKLQERIEQMPERAPQRRQQRVQDMVDELSPQMDGLQQQLQENIDQLGDDNHDSNQVQQQQQEIRDGMQEMSQQLTSMRSSMQQEQINVNIAALKSIFHSMLTLSEAQEDQNKITLLLEPNSQAFVQQARSQRNISTNFSAVVDSLFQVAKEVPQFNNATLQYRREVERNIDQSIDYLRERNRNQATTAERLSLGGLNRLTGMIADLIDQLDQDGDGGGGGGMSAEQMMEQMDQTGEQQQQLNQMIQDFINDMAGDRLTQDEIERLDQMARQQNEIRRQIEELQRSGNLRPGDRLLSEFERMLEDMEDTINDLRGGSTDNILVERQQNILSRMLETREAFDQRDESEERLGETPGEFEREDPPAMTLEELEREIRNRLQDPNQTRFTDDYQQLIRLYFQILQELEGEEVLSE